MIAPSAVLARLSMVLALGLLPSSLQAEETLRVKASSAEATVNLLTAAHTGKTICALENATPLIFLQRADHGAHRFAKVEVLEGECAGITGYISWFALDPKPKG